jgi:hypothetical protein
MKNIFEVLVEEGLAFELGSAPSSGDYNHFYAYVAKDYTALNNIKFDNVGIDTIKRPIIPDDRLVESDMIKLLSAAYYNYHARKDLNRNTE